MMLVIKNLKIRVQTLPVGDVMGFERLRIGLW